MVRTNKPSIAGWLDLAAGTIWILFIAFLTLLIIGLSVDLGSIHGRVWVILVAFALPGIFAITGGVFSLNRRAWIVALIGSISVMPLGFGIVALVLLVQSRREFT